jgi:pSer/pThr/pTyr-binding forkhead associated (FHA) protein
VGGSKARAVDVDRALVTIGRAPSNDIVLTDGRVSARHAQIERQGNRASIRDLQSTNGTYVNGQRIADAHPLAPGDTIRLGRTAWVVEAAQAPARPAAAIAHLTVTRGRAEPATLDLDAESDVTIGRGDDNDVVIRDDPRISRHHAQLTGTAAGHEIVDLGSTNGITVNGQRVSRTVLRDGDRIQLGDTELTYTRHPMS